MENAKGYVYVMINPSCEGLVKIGKTTKDPEERAKELSSATGVATPFIVAYKRMFNDCHVAEKTIHKMLTNKGVRINNSREFFRLPISDAINTIMSIADDSEPTIADDIDEEPMYYTLATNYYLGDNGFKKDYNKALEFYQKSILSDEKCEYLIWEYMSEIYEKLGDLQLAIKYAEKDLQECISSGDDSFNELYHKYNRLFELYIEGNIDSKSEDIFHCFFNSAMEMPDEYWKKRCILEDGTIFKESENFAQYCVWMIEPYIERNEHQIILQHIDVLSKFKNEILKILKEDIINNERLHLSNDVNFKMLEFINNNSVYIKANALLGICWLDKDRPDKADNAWKTFYNLAYDSLQTTLDDSTKALFLDGFIELFNAAIEYNRVDLLHPYYAYLSMKMGIVEHCTIQIDKLNKKRDKGGVDLNMGDIKELEKIHNVHNYIKNIVAQILSTNDSRREFLKLG